MSDSDSDDRSSSSVVLSDEAARLVSFLLVLIVFSASYALLAVESGRRLPTKRVVLFLFGCILLRGLLAIAAYDRRGSQLVQSLGALALLPALGFFYLYATKQRTTGLETGGEPIWWTDLRPVHGALWLSFAACALLRSEFAWLFLAADVTLGLGVWLVRVNSL